MSLPCFFVPSRISPIVAIYLTVLRSWQEACILASALGSDLRLGRLRCPWSAITLDMYVMAEFYVKKTNALPSVLNHF